jgi:hypothetical protein
MTIGQTEGGRNPTEESMCTSEFIGSFLLNEDGHPFIVTRLRRSLNDDSSRWICTSARQRVFTKRLQLMDYFYVVIVL